MKVRIHDSYAEVLKIQEQLHYRFKAKRKLKELKGWFNYLCNEIKSKILAPFFMYTIVLFTVKVYRNITLPGYTIKLIYLETRVFLLNKFIAKNQIAVSVALDKALIAQEKIISIKEIINNNKNIKI